MNKTVIEHVLSRLAAIGITHLFGVAGDFAFPILRRRKKHLEGLDMSDPSPLLVLS